MSEVPSPSTRASTVLSLTRDQAAPRDVLDLCLSAFRQMLLRRRVRKGDPRLLNPELHSRLKQESASSGVPATDDSLEDLTPDQRLLLAAYRKLPPKKRGRVLAKAERNGATRAQPKQPGLASWLAHESWRMAGSFALWFPFELFAPRDRMTRRLYGKALVYGVEARYALDHAKPPPEPLLARLTPEERDFADTHEVKGRPFTEVLRAYANGAKENPKLYTKRARHDFDVLALKGAFWSAIVFKLAVDKLMTSYLTTDKSLSQDPRYGMSADDHRTELILVAPGKVAFLRMGGDAYVFSSSAPVKHIELAELKRQLRTLGEPAGSHLRLELDLTWEQRQRLRKALDAETHIQLPSLFPREGAVLQATSHVNRILGLPTLPAVSQVKGLTRDYHRFLRLIRVKGIGPIYETLGGGGTVGERGEAWFHELFETLHILPQAKTAILVETARQTAAEMLAEREALAKATSSGPNDLLKSVSSPFLPFEPPAEGNDVP